MSFSICYQQNICKFQNIRSITLDMEENLFVAHSSNKLGAKIFLLPVQKQLLKHPVQDKVIQSCYLKC